MTIDQIECFVTVASTGSISQAAARLYRSQPNLSYTLKQLEKELGYPLLVRSNHGVTLSPGGTAFLSYAQKALRAFQQLQNFSSAPSAEGAPLLRLAAMPFCGATEAVGQLLRRENPLPHQILLNEEMRDDLIAGLNARQYDLGLAYAYVGSRHDFLTQLDMSELECTPLAPCVPCALVGRGSPWFDQPPAFVTPESLRRLHRIYYAKRGHLSYSRTQSRELADCAGTILAGDLLDLEMLLNTLPAFDLAPCAPALLRQGESIHAGLRCIPIQGVEQEGSYYAVYRKNAPPTGLALSLVTLLRQRLEGQS